MYSASPMPSIFSLLYKLFSLNDVPLDFSDIFYVFLWIKAFLQHKNEFIDIIVRKFACISKSPLQVFVKLFVIILFQHEQLYINKPCFTFLSTGSLLVLHYSQILFSSQYLHLISCIFPAHSFNSIWQRACNKP